MKMAKELKNIINNEKVKLQLIEDCIKITNIFISDLKISSISDNRISLKSNCIDDRLGVFSNSFRELSIQLDIEVEEYNGKEMWIVTPNLSYITKTNAIRLDKILVDKEFFSYYSYEYANDTLTLQNYYYPENSIRVIFKFNDNTTDKYCYMDFFDELTLKGLCRKVSNCDKFLVETMKNKKWEIFELEKDIVEYCYQILKNR